MSHLERCAWKLIDPEKFTLGVNADRCGKDAVIKILRPFRKNDLYLCACHVNEFIATWSLHNAVEILGTKETGCPCPFDCDGCHEGDGICDRGGYSEY